VDEHVDINISHQEGVDRIYATSQVADYVHRGEDIANFNVLRFFVDSYEESSNQRHRDNIDRGGDSEMEHRRPGRPRHQRSQYTPGHPKSRTHQRVIRPAGHRNLPNFIGRSFPRQDDSNIEDFYYACILTLLNPWRNLSTDLKEREESWRSAYERFLSSAPSGVKDIISGLQYFHECEHSANQSTVEHESADRAGNEDMATDFQPPSEGQEEAVDSIYDEGTTFSEARLADLLATQSSFLERRHGELAVEVAQKVGIFPTESESVPWIVQDNSGSRNATRIDRDKLSVWQVQMQQDIDRQNEVNNDAALHSVEHGAASVLGETDDHTSSLNTEVPAGVTIFQPQHEMPSLDPESLNDRQRRAFETIMEHLGNRLANHRQKPLRMILYGEGGTGKSRVIQTVTEAFAAAGKRHHQGWPKATRNVDIKLSPLGASHLLVKAAYTGVAAALIGGKTTHTIACVGACKTKDGTLSLQTRAKLQQFWRTKAYLIIDEYSMISKTFLETLSTNISIGKEGSDDYQPVTSFGGVSVILCGDLHQFPPVTGPPREHLFRPVDIIRDSDTCKSGRVLYEEFETVVILREQKRITDPIWHTMLTNLRKGHVQEEDISMLRGLIIGKSTPGPTDFDVDIWKNASLVTPRHGVRVAWNKLMSRNWCRAAKRQLLVCRTEDTVSKKTDSGRFSKEPLTLKQRIHLAEHIRDKTKRNVKSNVPEEVELAIGMEVIITHNLATDLDITNGARGRITQILLAESEPVIGNEPVVHLVNMPLCIMVKFHRTRTSKLEGLEERVIPVEPMTTYVDVNMNPGRNKLKQKTTRVTRRQFPITPAYAFTDYRSQGQTITRAIVDLAKPPTGKLTVFNVYVALSRSAGRGTIRLLRDFDTSLFRQSFDADLAQEDERLEKMDKIAQATWLQCRGECRKPAKFL
jgi:PIF1-like helicase